MTSCDESQSKAQFNLQNFAENKTGYVLCYAKQYWFATN